MASSAEKTAVSKTGKAGVSTPPDPRSWLERVWSTIGERGRSLAAEPGAAPTALDRARLLAEALLSERGEASGSAIARELHAVLHGMEPGEWLEFDRFLATSFLPSPEGLRAAAEAYLADPTAHNASRLADAADPPRQELLRRMNMSPGGTATLVAMRKDLLGWLRENPDLEPLDADLRHLLGSWFNRGFLELRRIDWQTQAAVPGEADRLRGGARNSGVGRSAPPSGGGSPLLRFFPSGAAR